MSIEGSTAELLIPELMGEEAKVAEGVFAEGAMTFYAAKVEVPEVTE